MNCWLIVFFCIIIPTHDFLILEDDENNPFTIFQNKSLKPFEETSVNDDNKENPFTLFYPITSERNFTKEEMNLSILLHVHLVKIFWNRIKSEETISKSIDSKVYPIDLKFSFELTKEMVNTIEAYLNKSEESTGAEFNKYFMNYLKVETVKAESPIFEESVKLWYETNIVVISALGAFVTSFFLMSKMNFLFLLLFSGVVHKGFEKYEEAELKRAITISKPIPAHCVDNSTSIWKSIKEVLNWDNKEECMQYYKDVHMKTHHSSNVLKIIPAVISDVFEGLFSSIGDIVGKTYQGLNKYMPWYMTPVFLLILILAAMRFFMIFAYKFLSFWWVNPRNNSTHFAADHDGFMLLERNNHCTGNCRRPARLAIGQSSYRPRRVYKK